MLNVIQIEFMELNTIGARIGWARKKLGLSQVQLGALAGIAPGTIGNIESGRGHSLRKLTAVARALRVDAHWLSEGVGLPYPEQVADTVQAIGAHRVVYLDPVEYSHLSIWRDADPDARTVIASAYAVADRLKSPVKRRA